MKASINAINLIKKYEGFSAIPYICPGNYLTIGYGHLIKKDESFSKISKLEAEKLLMLDLKSFELSIQKLISSSINQSQFDALCSFAYNLGAGALQRSTLRQKINRDEYIQAANEFSRWVYAGGKKLRGLVSRREAERQLFCSN